MSASATRMVRAGTRAARFLRYARSSRLGSEHAAACGTGLREDDAAGLRTLSARVPKLRPPSGAPARPPGVLGALPGAAPAAGRQRSRARVPEPAGELRDR